MPLTSMATPGERPACGRMGCLAARFSKMQHHDGKDLPGKAGWRRFEPDPRGADTVVPHCPTASRAIRDHRTEKEEGTMLRAISELKRDWHCRH